MSTKYVLDVKYRDRLRSAPLWKHPWLCLYNKDELLGAVAERIIADAFVGEAHASARCLN